MVSMAAIVPREIAYAPAAFRMLNGCICLYKPPRKGFRLTRIAFTEKIANGINTPLQDLISHFRLSPETELNSMECRPPRERIEITGDLSADNHQDLNVVIKPNLADHPLVSGPRYDPRHIALCFANYPGWYASGLMVGFIGNQAYKGRQFKAYNLPKIFEIKGELGLASLNYRDDGKVRIKSTYKHIRQAHFERVLAKIEAAQRTLGFAAAKVQPNSQIAYEMAAKGQVRPATKETIPLVVATKPVSFDPPNFVFQVECHNDNETFLAELVNEIGIALKSSARCTGIRLIRFGPFTVKHSLLQKHWTLENVIENIYECNKILEDFERNRNVS